MKHAERLRLFRPHVTLQKLDRREAELLTDLMRNAAYQAESLRLQLARGTKPRALFLDKNIVRQAGDKLAFSLSSAYSEASLAMSVELHEAWMTHEQGKPAVFKAAEKKPNPLSPGEFTPNAGIEWYRNYSLRLVGVEQIDALETAKQSIITGIEQGLPQQEVEGLLAQTFTDFSQNRLQMITRTETAKIYEQARYQQMDALEDVVGYEWSAILDARVCPICAARHGKRFPKEQIEGNMPPAHVQCRCMILPIFSWEIEEGDVQWDPIPASAPPVAAGFGTTSMEIPAPAGRAARRVLRQL